MWLFIIELASVQAFVISPTLHLYGSVSSLSYSVPRQDDINGEEKDTVSSAIENDFQKQLNEQLVDPACDIDDEECIEFSLALNSNINEVRYIHAYDMLISALFDAYDMLISLIQYNMLLIISHLTTLYIIGSIM